MTDLSRVLPDFPVGQFARLLPILEQHGLSTTDLLTLDAADIGKRTHLPLLDVKRFSSAVLHALHADLGVASPGPRSDNDGDNSGGGGDHDAADDPSRRSVLPGKAAGPWALRSSAASLGARWQTISTLDPVLDRALGGGVPAGYVTEVTGESGAGKTQFLLTLLLAVQLPPPHGLGRPALYISTEAPLSTRRLAQLLAAHPLLQRLPRAERPSLDNIVSTATPDLESQDHILSFQVPVEVERRGIGLVVLDSVAANYRAEFERSAGQQHQHHHGSNMGARTAELIRLGMHLRDLAQRHNLAVVVSNQVADRFATSSSSSSSSNSSSVTPASSLRAGPVATQESPLAARSRQHALPSDADTDADAEADPPPPPPPSNRIPQLQLQPSYLLLDHQQRWFTGWGDEPIPSSSSLSSPSFSLKTPSLGLVWSTQISARIALFRRPAALSLRDGGDGGVGGGSGSGNGSGRAGWRRWMKVVFAPHAGETGPGLEGAVEFEVWMGGLRAVGHQGQAVAGGEGRDDETRRGGE